MYIQTTLQPTRHLTGEDLRDQLRRSKKDQKVFQDLCESYTTFISKIVVRFAKYYPNKADDLMGTALLGLVEVIRKTDPEHPNPHRYIHCRIIGLLKNFVLEDQTFRKRRGRKNSETTRTKRFQFQSEEEYEYHFGEFREPVPTTTIIGDLILHDFLETPTLRKQERKILKYRLEGYNDLEIGQMMGYSQKGVQLLRVGMQSKILEIIS